VLGLTLGALFCDKIIPYGRFNAAIFANIIIVISIVPQMWLSVIPLCIGRFLLGIGSGLFTVISGVYMAETIPANQLSLYGTSINTGIITGLLVTNLI
jgi:MFS family permease